MRGIGVAVAVALATAAGVTACGGGSAHRAPVPVTTAAKTVAVSQVKLGAAMQRLVLQGQSMTSQHGDISDCLATAVQHVGMSRAGLLFLEATASDDLPAVAASMKRGVSPHDAALLSSDTLRTKTDACLNAAFPAPATTAARPKPKPKKSAKSKGKSKHKSSSHKPKHPKKAPAKKKSKTTPKSTKSAAPAGKHLSLTAVYHFKKGTQITTTRQLQPGLVSMFSSFGDAGQAAAIKAAGSCMSTAVLNAGFTQKTLLFIAGGAKISVGSVAAHLPDKRDVSTWNGSAFQQALSTCWDNPESDPDDGQIS